MCAGRGVRTKVHTHDDDSNLNADTGWFVTCAVIASSGESGPPPKYERVTQTSFMYREERTGIASWGLTSFA